MNNAMRIERLRKLAEVLSDPKHETPDVRKFDMYHWIAPLECGYAACALGSAALHPWFRRRGLKILDGEVPAYRGRIAIEAAMKFFGITVREADRLFIPENYDMDVIRRPSVIKRVNEVIIEYGGEPYRTRPQEPTDD